MRETRREPGQVWRFWWDQWDHDNVVLILRPATYHAHPHPEQWFCADLYTGREQFNNFLAIDGQAEDELTFHVERIA